MFHTSLSRWLCCFSLVGLLVPCSSVPAADTSAAADKPNILFIFADDQAYHTIHALGNAEIKTPNLDRLVQEGTTFTRTYNMGGWNGAICVASRTMMATGRYIWHAEAEVKKLKSEWVPQQKMWPQLMSAAGYQTFFTGKWHVQADNAQVFEVSRHVRGGMPAQTPTGYNRPNPDGSDPWSPYDKSFGGFWEGGTHWSEVVGNDSVEYLQMAAKDERPFFMYLAFNAPHDPRQSPKEFVDLYPVDDIAVPVTFLPEYPYDLGIRKLRDEVLAQYPRTEHAVQVHRQEYYAIITHMDQQIGRILDELDHTGQKDNTWIFFTADHGLACGNHGFLGKQNMYDHSIRVPFMVVGPDVEAGARIDAPIYLQSIMRTSLELADADVPDHIEFRSLLPLLSGDEEPADRPMYCGYMKTQRCVIADGHKLILYPNIKQALLYDLEADPHELTDLSETPGSTGRMRMLFAEMLKLQQATGDDVDLKTPFPQLAK